MKGIVYTKSGRLTGLKTKEVTKPSPESHQVLIKIKSSSINYLDYLPFKNEIMNSGHKIKGPTIFNRFLDPAMNQIMGCDFAGVVEEVGDDVVDVQPGDKVFGITDDFHFGAWAEYTCVDENKVAFTPSNLTFKECAVLPMAAGTAISAVNGAKVAIDKKVLLIGATGGVGLFAMQLAKSLGAEVTAVCKPAGMKFAHKLHIDHVVEATPNFAKELKGRYDSIIVINGKRQPGYIRRLLESDGYYVEIHQSKSEISKNPFGDMMEVGFRWHDGHFNSLIVRPDWLWKVANLAQRKSIWPYIDAEFSINDSTSAIEYVIQNHINGKVSLNIDFDEYVPRD
ncbi:NAD(P)-dependent alcohol dehydrogenase [Lactobacillaceae bacterium Scapto_B20]